jgi:hypothetical protein
VTVYKRGKLIAPLVATTLKTVILAQARTHIPLNCTFKINALPLACPSFHRSAATFAYEISI